jgi:HK97 family phage portal protein
MIKLNLEIPNKETRSNPTSPLSVGWHNLFDHGYSDAGVDVTPHTAMQGSSTVAACVRLISSSIGSLPLLLYAKNGNSKTQLFDHPVYSLLRYEPNPESTPQTLLTSLVQDVLLRGNGYLEITRTGPRISGLWYVSAEHVRVFRDTKTGDILYEICLGSNRRTLPPSSVIHVTGQPSSDGVTGLSCLQTSRDVIAESLAIQKHSNLYFGNVSTPAGILSTTERLLPEARSMIRESWHALVGGRSKFKTAVLDNSLTYTPLNPTSNIDSDLVKAKEWSRQAVCSLFGVPPALTASEAKTSGETQSSLTISFLESALKPIMKKIEAELVRKLFPTEKSKFAIEFSWMDLLRSDPATFMEALSVVRGGGIYSNDELREMVGLNSLGGDFGAMILAPVNMVDSRVLIGKAPDPKIKPVGNADNEGQQNDE